MKSVLVLVIALSVLVAFISSRAVESERHEIESLADELEELLDFQDDPNTSTTEDPEITEGPPGNSTPDGGDTTTPEPDDSTTGDTENPGDGGGASALKSSFGLLTAVFTLVYFKL